MIHPPAIRSLPAAIELAIRNGSDLSVMKLDRWAVTYACGVEDVKRAWEETQTRLSQEPINKFEENE